MLVRKPDWPACLDRFLSSRHFTPFAYGSFDCCLFVCDAIEAMTGTDVAAPFRGRYVSRRQAFRAMKTYAGHASVEAVTERVTHEHGMPEIPASRARRGDVVLIPRKFDYSLGLMDLSGRDVLVSAARGFERIALACAERAWHV